MLDDKIKNENMIIELNKELPLEKCGFLHQYYISIKIFSYEKKIIYHFIG